MWRAQEMIYCEGVDIYGLHCLCIICKIVLCSVINAQQNMMPLQDLFSYQNMTLTSLLVEIV